MSCCGKKSCQNTEPADPATTGPAAFSVLESSAAVIAKLVEVTKTGVCDFVFKDTKLNELAATISMLVAENQYLKKLARLLPGTPKIDIAPSTISFNFGPDSEYTLTVPVTLKNRQKLADQLFYAAMTLKAQEPAESVKLRPEQLLLFSHDAGE